MENLNKFQMKLVYAASAILTVISLASLIGGLWVCSTNSDQLLGALFPMLWGCIGLYNVYKIIMAIHTGNGTMTTRQVRSRFFSYSRGTLACLIYIFIVFHNVGNAVWMGFFTLLMIGGEILINHLESKAAKNNE